MSRYRKIEVRTWADEKFRALSPLPASGQGLWFFLLTGPQTGPVPGLFRAGRAAMAEELGWEQEAFDEAFREVLDQGMVKADFKAKLVWLPKAFLHNRPESPNVVKSWRTEINLLPECDLKNDAVASLLEYLEELGPAYVTALKGSDSQGADEADKPHMKPSSKPSRKPSSKPSMKAMPNQEQEQEQDIEAPSASPPKSPRGTSLRADWQLPDEWKAWAEQQRPDLDVRLAADAFRDFWIAKPGKDGRKADWQATWRNWVRNQRGGAPPSVARRPAGVGSFV